MSEQQEPQFGLQRIYVRDVSFEMPQGAALFSKEWRPSVQQDLNTRVNVLENGHYEVILTVTVTGTINEEPMFVVEVQQAGIFMIQNFADEQRNQIIGATCPNILFPYAREVIDNMLTRGTLPPLMLPPVNFDLLYQQALVQQAGATAH